MTSNYARKNNATSAKFDFSKVFGKGAFKIVYKGTYTNGERAGEACVCKMFDSGSLYETSFFASELEVVACALDIINKFNKAKIIDKEIWLNEPAIWTIVGPKGAKQKVMVEPMIANFEKFNSNVGWTPDNSTYWSKAMQALSHFSYHSSNRALLLCDLQGGVYKDGFVLTDPVIMSSTQEYGPTDLGSMGISTFFSNHQCNQYCNSQWLVPHDRKPYVTVQQGTMMALPTRAGRPPLTRN